MPLFLRCHVFDGLGRRRAARAEHRKLAFIDAHRAVFARMIDADHLRDLVGRARAGRRRAGFAAHFERTNCNAPKIAAPIEMIALYPASEIPKILSAARSHIGTGALRSIGPL